MNEMIERVARALCTRHYAARFCKSETDAHVISNVNYNWRGFEADAKAAIKAMREPTKELLEGVMQASLDCVPINRCEQQALQVWQNTIDEILK